MATKIPEPEDTELNMTPMIDIVFQLIVFFLLSLKFKAVDRRIDTALPKDRGIQATSEFVKELPMVTVKLFRENIETPDTSDDYTKIRVGNDYTFNLPPGDWTGKDQDEPGKLGDTHRQMEYDKTFAQVRQAILNIWDGMGKNPEAKGEIKTPRPKGLKVPHGDVMYVLDSFLQAGLTDVKFEGAPPPLPVAGGGGFATQGG